MKCNYCRKETTFQFDFLKKTIVCKKCGKRSPPSCPVNRCKHKFSPDTFSCVICGLEMMKPPQSPTVPNNDSSAAATSELTPADVLSTGNSLQGTVVLPNNDHREISNEEFMRQLQNTML